MRISDWSSDVCSSDLCDEPDALSRALPWRELVFARQKLRILAELRGLDPKDRITPIKAALQMEAAVDGAQVAGQDAPPDQVRGRLYGALLVEHPDSDAGKPLSGLARAFGNALRPALRKAGLLAAQDDASLPRLHVCFVDGDQDRKSTR